MTTRVLPPATPPAVQRRLEGGLDPQLRRVFGSPPLHERESPEDYDDLCARLRRAVAPADAVEEIWVRDIADLTWETLRLRRLKARLMDAAAVQGLRRVLTDLVPNYRQFSKVMDGWARGEERARNQVAHFLAEAGLDWDVVEAQTLSARLNDFERIDRIVMQQEARRHAVLREIDRRRSAVAARLRRVTDGIVGDGSDPRGSLPPTSIGGGDEALPG